MDLYSVQTSFFLCPRAVAIVAMGSPLLTKTEQHPSFLVPTNFPKRFPAGLTSRAIQEKLKLTQTSSFPDSPEFDKLS